MTITRRTLLAELCLLALSPLLAPQRRAAAAGRGGRLIDLIEAPNHLGLRPPAPGAEPGTRGAPAALDRAGLSRRLHPSRHVRLVPPAYQPGPQPGTRIRNGRSLRALLLRLAVEVEASLRRGAFPVVVGGDCSNLLGGLLALRRNGGRGLVHVDGHGDFAQLGSADDPQAHLGAAAGMDLALAIGRGEPLLTRWPGVDGPLVADADAVQLGEREADLPGYYHDIEATAIERITVQWVAAHGIDAAADRVLSRLRGRALDRAWLHIDLDVLDQSVMPAVDSPGRPGLGYDELAALVRRLLRSGRIAGLDLSIYDPELDPDGRYARQIVACVGRFFYDEVAP